MIGKNIYSQLIQYFMHIVGLINCYKKNWNFRIGTLESDQPTKV